MVQTETERHKVTNRATGSELAEADSQLYRRRRIPSETRRLRTKERDTKAGDVSNRDRAAHGDQLRHWK